MLRLAAVAVPRAASMPQLFRLTLVTSLGEEGPSSCVWFPHTLLHP